MKNVMIVARQGNAVALGEGTKICKSATGVFMPSLEALKEVLMAIPTEPCETVNIHIMDTIQGLVSGSAVEYVKTGKTLSGNALTNEEIESFKEVYKLYAERILNVRFSLVKYIRKDDTRKQISWRVETDCQVCMMQIMSYEPLALKANEWLSNGVLRIQLTNESKVQTEEILRGYFKERQLSKIKGITFKPVL